MTFFLVCIPRAYSQEADTSGEELQPDDLLVQPVNIKEVEDNDLLIDPVSEETIEPVVVGYEELPDPLEPFNRLMFGFNDGVYRFALIPLGNVYREHVPEPVKGGVTNFFHNLQEPLHTINHGVQGELSDAGRNIVRFLTNSTVGVLGIFDPAEAWFGIEETPETFAETFEHYGIGAGPYLVMPLAGPTDLRGGTSLVASSFLHPVRYVTEDEVTTGLLWADGFQRSTEITGSYLPLKEQSDDPYEYFRNQYLQGRMRDREFDGTGEEQ